MNEIEWEQELSCGFICEDIACPPNVPAKWRKTSHLFPLLSWLCDYHYHYGPSIRTMAAIQRIDKLRRERK